MKIFITSSWINRHAVDLLACFLQGQGHDAGSFVADNETEYSAIGQNRDIWAQSVDYGEWVNSAEGERIFNRDIESIKAADMIIVIEPAGRDSWAHIGLAYALGKKILGLNSRGRKVGLMRRMALWFRNIIELLDYLSK